MKKIKYFISLILPEYFIITVLTVIAASLIISGMLHIRIIFAILAISFSMVGLNVTNNIFDIELDKINKPERPLVRKFVTLKEAEILAVTSFILGLLFSLFIDIYSFLMIVFFIILSVGYSHPKIYLKKYLFSSNIIGSIVYGAIPFLLTWRIYENKLPFEFLFLFMALIFSMAPLKDIEDMEGEKGKGIKTLPIIVGKEKTIKIILILFYFIQIVFLFLEASQLINIRLIYATLISIILTTVVGVLYLKDIKRTVRSGIITQSKLVTITMILVTTIEIIYGTFLIVF